MCNGTQTSILILAKNNLSPCTYQAASDLVTLNGWWLLISVNSHKLTSTFRPTSMTVISAATFAECLCFTSTSPPQQPAIHLLVLLPPGGGFWYLITPCSHAVPLRYEQRQSEIQHDCISYIITQIFVLIRSSCLIEMSLLYDNCLLSLIITKIQQ